jgi:hypothetical protein
MAPLPATSRYATARAAPAGEPEPAMMLTPTTDVVNNNVVFYHAAARCTVSGGVNDG